MIAIVLLFTYISIISACSCPISGAALCQQQAHKAGHENWECVCERCNHYTMECQTSSCQSWTNKIPQLREGAYCADEGGYCSCHGTVYYGQHGTGFYGMISHNHYTRHTRKGTKCNNKKFGDPIPGTFKQCYCVSN